MKVTGGE